MNQVCPNNDPQFDKLFITVAGDATVRTRRYLYYGVCIPIRFVLYLVMIKYHTNKAFLGLVALVSAYAFYRLMYGENGVCVSSTSLPSSSSPSTYWWSKKFQAIMALGMTVFSLSGMAGKTDTTIVPFLMLVSILGGLAQSVRVSAHTRIC